MRVTKRDGSVQEADFNKIQIRLEALAQLEPRLENVDLSRITQKVVGGVVDGISTHQLDTLAAETAAGYISHDPDYDRLAARITISDLHKRTHGSLLAVCQQLRDHKYSTCESSVDAPLVTEELVCCAKHYEEWISAETDHARDHRTYTYFGIKTLLNGYLMPGERPSHMLWRVAFGIHGMNWGSALATYKAMSSGAMTHASPTLFYAGTPAGALSSCYLSSINDDSIPGIYDAVRDCAIISKSGGGVGLAVSKVRASGALVKTTGRPANGILPALRVLNETARHVTQGGRRKGAIAVYVEPHHADVFDIVAIRLNHGTESNRCRDLFPALWVPDLFMERVHADASWTLFSPDTAPGLDDVWGDEYAALYQKYESAGLAFRTVQARDLWNAILTAQIETGTPYILYKDTVNRCNAQSNVGPIRCSNLCSEITLHVSAEETAVCNLASIALPHFVDEVAHSFDFDKLAETVRMTVVNLDAVIDRTHNPTQQTAASNARNRPIGIGVQGLADVFMALRLPFESSDARALNVDIFECIYHAALSESCALAHKHGVYPSYPGSPASKGLLQPDLFLAGEYGSAPQRAELQARVSSPKWSQLRKQIAEHGLRHSCLTALMPTASTAQLLGNTEAFEALGSNLYVRRTLSGEFTVINHRLAHDLRAVGLWTKDARDAIIRNDGSIQSLSIPASIKSLYRTVWEVSQKHVCQMAADRAPFVDQSQSLNIHMASPTFQKLTSLHFHNHKLGLKTSSYYLRTQAASSAIKFTLEPSSKNKTTACENEVCVMCSA